jgi:hypothetical protein
VSGPTSFRYTRSYETQPKQLSVLASNADELKKKFNRIIVTDERSMVALKPAK